MTTMTANYLIEAIREAESLEELQRMVGPSENDETLNRQRLAKSTSFGKNHKKKTGLQALIYGLTPMVKGTSNSMPSRQSSRVGTAKKIISPT